MIIIAVFFILMGLWIIWFNWKSFYENVIKVKYYGSPLPFVGALFLAVGLYMALPNNMKYYALVAFIIDYASLPFIFYNLLFSVAIKENGIYYITILNKKIPIQSKKQIKYIKYYDELSKLSDENLMIELDKEIASNHQIELELNNEDVKNQFLNESLLCFFKKYRNIKIYNYQLDVTLIDEKNESADVTIGYFHTVSGMKNIYVKKYSIVNIGTGNNMFLDLLLEIHMNK